MDAFSDSLMQPGELLDLVELLRPSRHDRAACRGLGPAAFFPEAKESQAAVVALCVGCAVRLECAAAGELEGDGVWAGRSGWERKRRHAA